MNPTQPFRFSAAERLVLLASALSGVGVTLTVVRPEDGLAVAAPILLVALAAAAAGVALHFAKRRGLRRVAARRKADAAVASPARPDWGGVAPA